MSTKNENKNKPVPALMRKTKAQLVDIILRKDNIECGLRNDIKVKDDLINRHQEKLAEVNNQLNIKNNNYNTLKAEFESTCDEDASIICDLKEIIKRNNSVIFKLYIALIISVIIIICLCCL